MSATPKSGEWVRFVDAGRELAGICNGEPWGDDPATYLIPVHIPEGNRNLLVHITNVLPPLPKAMR